MNIIAIYLIINFAVLIIAVPFVITLLVFDYVVNKGDEVK